MSKHKKRKGKPEEKQTVGQMIKDLFLHPFSGRNPNARNSLGKFLGGVCIFLAICLLFYLTGHNI